MPREMALALSALVVSERNRTFHLQVPLFLPTGEMHFQHVAQRSSSGSRQSDTPPPAHALAIGVELLHCRLEFCSLVSVLS